MISAIPDLDSSPSTIVLVIGFAVAALSVLLKIVELGRVCSESYRKAIRC